jgi:hypothetical protein
VKEELARKCGVTISQVNLPIEYVVVVFYSNQIIFRLTIGSEINVDDIRKVCGNMIDAIKTIHYV